MLSVQNPEHVKAKMELERTAKKIQSQENELKALQEKEKERESKCQRLRKQLQDLRAGKHSLPRFDQTNQHVPKHPVANVTQRVWIPVYSRDCVFCKNDLAFRLLVDSLFKE